MQLPKLERTLLSHTNPLSTSTEHAGNVPATTSSKKVLDLTWAVPKLDRYNSEELRRNDSSSLSTLPTVRGKSPGNVSIKSPEMIAMKSSRASFPLNPGSPVPSSANSTPKSSEKIDIERETKLFLLADKTSFRCYDCSINFTSQSLLNRHITFSTIHKETLAKKSQLLANEEMRRRVISTSSSDAQYLFGTATDDGTSDDNDEGDDDYDDEGSEREYEDQYNGDQELASTGYCEDSRAELASTSMDSADEKQSQSGYRTPPRSRAQSFNSDGCADNISNEKCTEDKTSSNEKGKRKVMFKPIPPKPSESEIEARAYIADLVAHGEMSSDEASDLMSNLNSGWSKAVSKIRMHNEFARINQLICAYFHVNKRDDKKAMTMGIVYKVMFEGTKFLKISASIGEVVEVVVRHLDDEATKAAVPGHGSVIEVIGYAAGSGRQREIARTYLSYNSLTILLHDEIKKAAAEFRAKMSLKPSHAADEKEREKDKESSRGQNPEIVSTKSTTAATSGKQRQHDLIGEMNSSSVLTTSSKRSTDHHNHTTSTPALLSMKSGKDKACVGSHNSSKLLGSTQSSKSVTSSYHGSTTDTDAMSGTLSSSSSVPTNGASEKSKSGKGNFQISLLQYQQSQGHGQQFHDGVERRVSNDVIVHFILAHLQLERLYSGSGYNIQIATNGAKVGDVLGAVLDRYVDMTDQVKA